MHTPANTLLIKWIKPEKRPVSPTPSQFTLQWALQHRCIGTVHIVGWQLQSAFSCLEFSFAICMWIWKIGNNTGNPLKYRSKKKSKNKKRRKRVKHGEKQHMKNLTRYNENKMIRKISKKKKKQRKKTQKQRVVIIHTQSDEHMRIAWIFALYHFDRASNKRLSFFVYMSFSLIAFSRFVAYSLGR